jgi:hypothetical protein
MGDAVCLVQGATLACLFAERTRTSREWLCLSSPPPHECECVPREATHTHTKRFDNGDYEVQTRQFTNHPHHFERRFSACLLTGQRRPTNSASLLICTPRSIIWLAICVQSPTIKNDVLFALCDSTLKTEKTAVDFAEVNVGARG